MATVIGLVQAARAYLPHSGGKRSRAPALLIGATPPQPVQPASVADLIEHQIIPRLMVAHRGESQFRQSSTFGGDAIAQAEAVAFAPLALEVEADTLLDHVEIFLRRGVAIDAVFVELLAPAARYLGQMWDDDRCDFVDVTMGLWRLQEVIRELSARTPGIALGSGDPRRALFSPMPDEQHSLGTVMIEDIFRRDGWSTDLVPGCDTPELLDRVARRAFDLVGLTVSVDAHIERLPSLMLAVRSVSRNPRICIMLGGRVLTADPTIAARVGADGTAADAREALEMASRLVGAAAGREVMQA